MFLCLPRGTGNSRKSQRGGEKNDQSPSSLGSVEQVQNVE
jgi:hypothetical protein